MTIKPFAIQGADLTLGGVNLQAGATAVVIPGVTQAANYFAEEVNERDVGSNNQDLGSNANAITVIDNAEYLYQSGDATASGSYVAATYSVDELDNGNIEEINVDSVGVFLSADLANIDRGNMWATLFPTPFVSFNAGDWTEIPFRPKMRAGEVENISGIGGGVVERGVVFPGGEAGDTAGTLADENGTLYYCTQDWTDVNDFNKTFEVDNTADFDVGQTGGTSNSIKILAADYPGLKNILDTLNNTNIDYQTDFTVDGGGDFGGAQTVNQVSYNGTTIDLLWPHRTGVDPTSILQGEVFTVIYTGTIAQPAIWSQLSSGIALDENGNLTLPGDITVGATTGGRFIQDCNGGTTSMRWINVSQGSSSTQLLRAYTGDPAQDNEVERAQIKLNWDVTENKSGLTIRTFDDSDDSTNHNWLFKGDGVLQLPVGGDIVDSNGNSVLGGGTSGDANIWIETFESDAPTDDFVQAATSVEYDASGNIFALFNHGVPSDNNQTYTSVAKLSPAGTVLWQVRFSVNLNTDGWGLAYDGADTVYVAGRTSGTPLTYEFATLTKIDAVDGTIVWSKTYDFEANSSSAVVDVDSDLNPIMVGYAYNGTDNYIVTTKVDQADGLVIWSKTIDGQGYDEAYGMAVGPTGEVVTIGYVDQYDESTTYSVTPQTGSGVNVLVINRSDLSGAVFTDTSEVSGTGITGTIGVNAINVYTGLTGTVRQGTGAVFEITNVGDGTYYGSGIQNNGTTYLPGHKILVLGTDLGGATPANDCIVTVDSVTEGGLIFNWSVTGTAAGGSTTFNQLADYNNLSFNQFSGPSPVIIINVASGAFLAGIQAGTYGIGTRYSLPTGGVPLVLEVTSAYTDFGGGSYGVDVSIVSGSNPFVSGFESVTVTPSGAGATVYTPVTGTNYQTGSGVTFNFFSDSGSTYSALPVEITAVGSNYVLDDVVTISGALLGGTSPENDMTVTVNANLGAVVAFMSFSGTQQTTTYRVRTEDNGIDFSGTGTWTLSNVESDQTDRMVVIKYATDGTIAWQKAIQFDAGYACTGADADIDADGNIYVCGQYEYDYNTYTTSAMSLVKFDSIGVKQWSRRVVGNCDTFATSVVVGPDNYLYLSGVTGNDINSEYTWVVAKYNTFGVVEWQRLIDNTTSWTFGGTFWFGGAGGGSNIAVGNGYVALAGSFGDPGTQPKATIVQIDTDATEFSVGDWDFKAATFSGLLDDSASDITVTDAGKTTGNTAPTAADFVTSSDSSNFLLATRAGAASGDSINNGAYSVSVGSNGVVTMATSRGSLEFGALPEVGGQSHFHIMKAAGDNADLFLGDDFNYVLQRGPAYIGSPAYGVEIGTNDNNGGAQNSWRFGTDGSLTLPAAGIVKAGADTAQVGSSLVIATGSAYGDTAVSIASNTSLVSTYLPGGTITFQDGDVRTITQIDDYPGGTDIFWNTSKTGTLFPIILKTANYAAATTSPEWEFDTNGFLTVPGTIVLPEGVITFNGDDDPGIVLGSSIKSVFVRTLNGIDQYTWKFGTDGGLTFPDATVQTTAYTGGGGDATGVSRSDDNLIIRLTDPQDDGLELRSIVVDGNDMDVASTVLGSNGFIIRTNSNVSQKEWQFGNDGSTTLPGAVVNSTVAKTGVILPTITGTVETLSISPSISGLTDGTYGPFTLGVATFSVLVVGGVINGITNLTSTGDVTVGDNLGTIDSGDIGGIVGATPLTITVSNVVQATPTALDLTKTVNVIGAGNYSLADGVEGQIMYFVPSSTHGNTSDAYILVSNARIVINVVGMSNMTDYSWTPFTGESLEPTTIAMAIFADGAWCLRGGATN